MAVCIKITVFFDVTPCSLVTVTNFSEESASSNSALQNSVSLWNKHFWTLQAIDLETEKHFKLCIPCVCNSIFINHKICTYQVSGCVLFYIMHSPKYFVFNWTIVREITVSREVKHTRNILPYTFVSVVCIIHHIKCKLLSYSIPIGRVQFLSV